jgi:hypothetical protein
MMTKRQKELLNPKPVLMTPQPPSTESPWTLPAVSKQTGIDVAANLSVKKFVDEHVLEPRMGVLEPRMGVLEPRMGVLEPRMADKTKEKPSAHKEIIYATATGETNYSPTTHNFKETTYEPATSHYHDDTAQGVEDALNFNLPHIRHELREGIWQALVDLNIQKRPANFENIISCAISSLQMMYPRWANAPDTLSSGVRQQVGKMVYNRFENSKIEHIAEQVSRMRRQWALHPREDTVGLDATNAIHSDHELSQPGGAP